MLRSNALLSLSRREASAKYRGQKFDSNRPPILALSESIASKGIRYFDGLLASSSKFIEDTQRADIHSISTVVENVLRTAHDIISQILVPHLLQTYAVPASSTTSNTNHICSGSEELTVNHVIMSVDVYGRCDQLYRVSGTQCG